MSEIKQSDFFEYEETQAYWNCRKCNEEHCSYGLPHIGDVLECCECGEEHEVIK